MSLKQVFSVRIYSNCWKREKKKRQNILAAVALYIFIVHIRCLHSFMRWAYLSLFWKCWKIVFMFANVNSRQILFRCVTLLLLSISVSLSRQQNTWCNCCALQRTIVATEFVYLKVLHNWNKLIKLSLL